MSAKRQTKVQRRVARKRKTASRATAAPHAEGGASTQVRVYDSASGDHAGIPLELALRGRRALSNQRWLGIATQS
jgi:hypothetical protein